MYAAIACAACANRSSLQPWSSTQDARSDTCMSEPRLQALHVTVLASSQDNVLSEGRSYLYCIWYRTSGVCPLPRIGGLQHTLMPLQSGVLHGHIAACTCSSMGRHAAIHCPQHQILVYTGQMIFSPRVGSVRSFMRTRSRCVKLQGAPAEAAGLWQHQQRSGTP